MIGKIEKDYFVFILALLRLFCLCMKTCLLFGIFDEMTLEIEGVIQQAHSKCENLHLVVASDEMVRKFRNDAQHTQQERVAILRDRFPDLEVLKAGHMDTLEVIREQKPDKIFLGYNQIGFRQDLSEKYPDIEIERLDPVHVENE